LELIRTTLKEKLPKGFSYPIGAEALSTALAGVPQFHEASIHFSWKDTFWASKYNAKIRAAGSVNVFEVNFWNEWRIFVHAVPSEHSEHARRQLAPVLASLQSRLVNAPLQPTYFHWHATYDLATHVLAIGS
jgi:hypothetical protein